MNPLKHNNDRDPLLVTTQETPGHELNPVDPIEKWLSEFPMDKLPEIPVEIHVRTAETKGEFGRGIYRRLRVRVSLSEWMPWIPEPNPNAHLPKIETNTSEPQKGIK